MMLKSDPNSQHFVTITKNTLYFETGPMDLKHEKIFYQVKELFHLHTEQR